MGAKIARSKSITVVSKGSLILIMMMTRISSLQQISYPLPIRKIIKLFGILILISRILDLLYKLEFLLLAENLKKSGCLIKMKKRKVSKMIWKR